MKTFCETNTCWCRPKKTNKQAKQFISAFVGGVAVGLFIFTWAYFGTNNFAISPPSWSIGQHLGLVWFWREIHFRFQSPADIWWSKPAIKTDWATKLFGEGRGGRRIRFWNAMNRKFLSFFSGVSHAKVSAAFSHLLDSTRYPRTHQNFSSTCRMQPFMHYATAVFKVSSRTVDGHAVWIRNVLFTSVEIHHSKSI